MSALLASARDAPGPVASPSRQPATIRRLAVRALLAELVTYPKPGLVSLVDAGSHDDMRAATFVRSARALRGDFARLAAAGAATAEFEPLRRLGVAAEARMLAATGGVNTHRGAIFALGLLAAAAGRAAPGAALGAVVRATWGAALRAHRRDAASHGDAAHRRHGLGGALDEAAAGFPHLFDVVLPAYRAALAAGASANGARVHAFFASLAVLPDTNLVYRGGTAGLADARAAGRAFVAAGGVLRDGWRDEAVAVHRAFVARRLSPGGSADLLAACLFVHALDGRA